MTRTTCEHFVPLEFDCYECERIAKNRRLSRLFGLTIGAVGLMVMTIIVWEIVQW